MVAKTLDLVKNWNIANYLTCTLCVDSAVLIGWISCLTMIIPRSLLPIAMVIKDNSAIFIKALNMLTSSFARSNVLYCKLRRKVYKQHYTNGYLIKIIYQIGKLPFKLKDALHLLTYIILYIKFNILTNLGYMVGTLETYFIAYWDCN